MSKINCKFCDKKFGVNKIVEHLPDCILNFFNDKSGYLIEFISRSYITNKNYQMFAVFGKKCKFSHIDKFLKNEWCECCGHMSTLEVLKNKDDRETHSIKLSTLISKYENTNINTNENINQFIYNYDMGSTTTVYFKILKKFSGDNNNSNVELLYRNEPFKIKCADFKKCKGVSVCIYEGDTFCLECKNNLDESEYILNLLNSPLTGICGYGI